uniref:Uncharacterized protein n=1 Tax=Panagrolaimus sp. PS1159 TaxID=55785 RepID=A0AC35FZT9_9BILA
MKTKIRFFIHAFISSIFHAIAIFAPTIIRPYMTSNYGIYLTATTNLVFYHSLNEFLFVLFTTTSSKETKSSSNVTVIAANGNRAIHHK